MPELPEVETVARKLKPQIRKRTCSHVKIHDKKLPLPPKNLKDYQVIEVTRHGKEVLITFSNNNKNSLIHLLVHLRMTGRLLYNKNLTRKSLEDSESFLKHKVIRIKSDNFSKHNRATISFDKGELYFFDVRRFGTFKWSTETPHLPEGVIDPVKDVLESKILKKLLDSSKRQNLKAFLLRQDKIVGIGNIYASEILFKAKISPFRECQSLNDKEISLLSKSIKDILIKAIKNNGTTFSDFQDSNSETGSNQNFLFVYGREGLKCKKCKSEIIKVNQNQRSTFYCKNCQK